MRGNALFWLSGFFAGISVCALVLLGLFLTGVIGIES